MVLPMDVCPAHLDRRALEALANNGIWTVFLPAKPRLLLQPLDTHVFSKYKRRVPGKYRRHLLASKPYTCTVADSMGLSTKPAALSRRVTLGTDDSQRTGLARLESWEFATLFWSAWAGGRCLAPLDSYRR